MSSPWLVDRLRGANAYVRMAANVIAGPSIFRSAMRAQGNAFPGGALVLSFDCDFPADVQKLPALSGLLTGKGIRGSFAVVGQWVEKYPKEHRCLVEHGHEIINHTHTHPNLRNDDYEFSRGPQFTNRMFESLTLEERREELLRCHAAVKEVLGVEMTGCRLPHFGNLDPAEIYSVLDEIGYRFSSSAMAVLTDTYGVPFRTKAGVWELPVTGCPRHPYTAFDTWHCLVKNGGRHSRPGELAALLARALDLAQGLGALAVVYFDPKDILGQDRLESMLEDVAARDGLEVATCAQLLDAFEACET